MRELDFGFVNVGDSRIITFKVRAFFEMIRFNKIIFVLRLEALWIFPLRVITHSNLIRNNRRKGRENPFSP